MGGKGKLSEHDLFSQQLDSIPILIVTIVWVKIKQEAQGATVAHLSTINASKIWLRNGTKNNNTSSYMFQDHCYAFGLLL